MRILPDEINESVANAQDRVLSSLIGLSAEMPLSRDQRRARFYFFIKEVFDDVPPYDAKANYFLGGLRSFINDLYDHKIRSEPEISSGDGYAPVVVDNTIYDIRVGAFDFFNELFTYSLALNKSDCILYFHALSFPLKQEVKGLTHALVNEVINTESTVDNEPAEETKNILTDRTIITMWKTALEEYKANDDGNTKGLYTRVSTLLRVLQGESPYEIHKNGNSNVYAYLKKAKKDDIPTMEQLHPFLKGTLDSYLAK